MAYPNATITHYPITASDHSPLLLSLFVSIEAAPKPFKFEGFWLQDDSCLGVVTKAWNSVGGFGYGQMLFHKIRATRFALRRWNKYVFGNIQMAIRRVKGQLEYFQQAAPTSQNLYAAKQLSLELDEHLRREESLWRQKSREMWLVSSDLNTKFYHASTVIRRCRNQLMKLKTEESGWVSGRAAIGQEMVMFYQKLFSTSNPSIPEDLENLIEPLITEEKNSMLTIIPDEEEIFATLRKMSSEKAPGPDGMTVLFFKHFSHVVGVDVTKAVHTTKK